MLQKPIILLNESHFILLCALYVNRTFKKTATEHYATIWSICILHGSALT